MHLLPPFFFWGGEYAPKRSFEAPRFAWPGPVSSIFGTFRGAYFRSGCLTMPQAPAMAGEERRVLLLMVEKSGEQQDF